MRPAPRLIALLGAWSALAAAALLIEDLEAVWLVSGAALLAASLLDLVRARRGEPPEAERRVAASLPLGNWCAVHLRLTSASARPARISIFDHSPPSADLDGMPQVLVLGAGARAEIAYRIRPRSRGEIAFSRVEMLIRSPWGLWALRRESGEPAVVRVYPDFGTVARYALLAVDNRTSQLGIRRRPRRGEGIELHSLRDYREGDALRQIDWKATSRRRKLISREYQDERDQQIVFLLDCGRSMRSLDRGQAHFDHALRSLLLLGYIALRQGDSVGLMTFGGVRRWVAPVKGPGAMKALLHGVYDLEASTDASDYAEASTRLMGRLRKRALVVIVSNLRDEDGSELAASLRLLRRRHLVLVASLREPALDRALDEPVVTFEDALRAGAIHDYLIARRRAHRSFAGRGIETFDVVPADLPISIVNRYLDIKRSGAL